VYSLSDIQLFSKLSPTHITEIENNSVVRSYSKNSIVFYEGDKKDYLFVILEGTIKLYKTSPKGTQVHINRMEAPSLVGEYACFERMPFPATCEFITDGKVMMIPYSIIYKHMSNPDFAMSIVKSLTSKIMILSSLIHKETIYSSEAKVAKILLENKEIFSRLKYNEVADILNLTPETLSRIFKKMKKEKIIEVASNHDIKILDHKALEDAVEHNKVQKRCTHCVANFKSMN